MIPIEIESPFISIERPSEPMYLENTLSGLRKHSRSEPILEEERFIRPKTEEIRLERQARIKAQALEVLAILADMRQNGLNLRLLTPKYQADPHIVFTAVHQNGLAVEYASEQLRDTLNIALAAVTQNGLALQFMSDSLRNNKAVVKKAVMQNGLALQYASISLQNTFEIAREACRQNPAAVSFVSTNLKELPFYRLTAPVSEGN